MKVRLLKKAEADLDEIWDFIALDNPAAATDTIESILKGLKKLKAFPESGRARGELHPGLRSCTAAYPYVAFYLVLKLEIHIVRILYGSRDMRRIFKAK